MNPESVERLPILDGRSCQHCKQEATFWNIHGYFCADHWKKYWEQRDAQEE